MKLLLIVASLAVAGYFGWQRFAGGDTKLIERDGVRTVLATVPGGKAEYEVVDGGEETYMVFGASPDGDFASHGWFAGIPIKTAARLKQRYPDFTRCDSPGAAEAEKRVEDVKILTLKRGQQSEIRRLAAEFNDRIQSNGERLCVTLRGDWLALAASDAGGERLTADQLRKIMPAQAFAAYYVLAREIVLRDCKDLM